MPIRRLFPIFVAVVIAALSSNPLRADLIDSLSKDQLAKLKAGQMVVAQRDVEGGVWPEVTVFTKVNAPEAVLAKLFRDYKAAPSYQPGLVSAKVVAQPSPNVYDVQYTSKLPLLGQTTYTVRNTFDESADNVSVKWSLLKSDTADISDGSLQAETFDGGSLLRYTNYVKPKAAIAGLARGAALGEAKKTVSEIKAEAERRAKSQ